MPMGPFYETVRSRPGLAGCGWTWFGGFSRSPEGEGRVSGTAVTRPWATCRPTPTSENGQPNLLSRCLKSLDHHAYSMSSIQYRMFRLLYASLRRWKTVGADTHKVFLRSGSATSIFCSILVKSLFSVYVGFPSFSYCRKIAREVSKNKIRLEAISDTGVLLGWGQKTFFYFPLGSFAKKAQDSQFQAYRAIKGSEPEGLSELVRYQLIKKEKDNISYLKSDLLDSPCEAEAMQAGMSILSTFRDAGAELGSIPPNLQDSLEYGLKVLPVSIRRAWRSRLLGLFSRDFCLGYSHGDLTPSNIMFYEGRPVIIDLDRFSFCAPLFYDEVHFSLNILARKTQNDWMSIICDVISGKEEYASLVEISKRHSLPLCDILDLYFIIRVSYDGRGATFTPLVWKFRVRRHAIGRAATFQGPPKSVFAK